MNGAAVGENCLLTEAVNSFTIPSFMPPSREPNAAKPADQECLQDAVEGLAGEVHSLSQQIEVLRVAIDDLRQEVEFAVRNLTRPAWTPTQPLTSMPIDPVAEDFSVNQTKRDDVPIADTRLPSTPKLPTPTPTATEPVPPRRKRKPRTAALF